MTAAPRPSRRAPGRARRAWSVAVLSAALLAGCTATADPAPPAPRATPVPPTAAPAPERATPDAAPQALEPARVAIERIGLDEALIPLGVTSDGTMEVPVDFDDVGWFTGGGRPGGHGPLVIAGHVDSPTGPAVFLRLRELEPGDLVVVTDAAGEAHRYRVTEVADHAKAAFPTVEVFGAVTRDVLRLITCGGVFDPDAGSYTENRVVSAEREG